MSITKQDKYHHTVIISIKNGIITDVKASPAVRVRIKDEDLKTVRDCIGRTILTAAKYEEEYTKTDLGLKLKEEIKILTKSLNNLRTLTAEVLSNDVDILGSDKE